MIGSLPKQIRAAIEQKREAVEAAIHAAVRELRRLDGTRPERQSRRSIGTFSPSSWATCSPSCARRTGSSTGWRAHFDAIEADIAANLDQYKRFTQAVLQETPAQLVAQAMEEREQLLRRYGVNLFVLREEGSSRGAPVVHERHPTYFNLFGRIDYEARFGALTTDFTRIRPGSVHQANGGFLIVQLEDLLSDGRSWLMLKRALEDARGAC